MYESVATQISTKCEVVVTHASTKCESLARQTMHQAHLVFMNEKWINALIIKLIHFEVKIAAISM